MQGTGVQLSQSLTRATQAAMIYTLTFPLNVRTPLRPPELGADEPAWVAEVRAVAVQAAKEGAHISHVVVLSSDSLSNSIISLFQIALHHVGAPSAKLFHSSPSITRAADMLSELIAVWMRGELPPDEAAATPDVDSDDEESQSMTTPVVASRAFLHSVLGLALPRILLLVPAMSQQGNEQIHRQLLAMDANANLHLNQYSSHTYVTRPTPRDVQPDDTQLNRAPSPAVSPLTASRGIVVADKPVNAPAPAALFLEANATVPFESSIFAVPLAAPVLLEYQLYRSAISDVWTDLSRLQATLEKTCYDRARGTVVVGSHFPASPDRALASSRHTRLYSRVAAHSLRRILLLPLDITPPDSEMQRAAETIALSRRLSGIGPLVGRSPLASQMSTAMEQRELLDARNLASVKDVAALLTKSRLSSAWAGQRMVFFDSNEAGKLASSLFQRHHPTLAMTPTFASLLSPTSVYESLMRLPPGSQVVVIGATSELLPLAGLLVHDGLSSHSVMSRQAVQSVMSREGLLDLECCHPELPTSLMHTTVPPQTMTEKLKFQVTRIFNSAYVRLESTA